MFRQLARSINNDITVRRNDQNVQIYDRIAIVPSVRVHSEEKLELHTHSQGLHR